MANISFDANYYYEQKLNQLQSTDSEQYGDWTIADVALSFNENGLTPEEHYEKYGVGEGLNPSAAFDTQAYLSAKLGQLQEQDSEQYADWTVEDVAQAFEDNGLSPLAHFNQFGQDEGLEAVPAGDNTSDLTEALAALSTAQTARVDFLEATYESNEDIAATVGDEFDATVTANTIDAVYADAISNAGSDDTPNGVNDLITTFGDDVGTVDADRSDAYNQAIIDEQKSILADNVETAQETVDETDGLNAAVQALAAAQEGLGEAIEAQADTNADLQGGVTAYETANNDAADALSVEYGSVTDGEYTKGSNVDLTDLDLSSAVNLVTDGDNGDAAVVQMTTKGEIVLTSAYEDSDKAASLLSAVQSDVAAIQELDSATGNLNSAIAEVLVLEGTNEITTETISTDDSEETTPGTDDVTFTGAALYEDADGNVFVGEADTATNGTELYAVTDLNVDIAANGDLSVTANFSSAGGADADYAAEDYTLVDADNPLSFTASDVDASAFIDATAGDNGYIDTSSDFATLAEDSNALATALNDQSAFNDAVERYTEAKSLAEELGEQDSSVSEARDAIQDEDEGLGISLLEGSESFTVDDDVYLFNAEESADASLAKFGANGEDNIFFGEGYSLVALGDDAITDNVGDANAQEIFWEQAGNDVNLYVEAETFGGNSAGTADVTQVTLTGVDGADINDELSAGFLSAGEVA